MAKNYNLKKSMPYHLATDISVVSPSYNGVSALPYLAPVVKSALSIENGYLTELDGITEKAVVSVLTPGTMLGAANCDWKGNAASGSTTSLTLGESVLDVTDMMVNQSVCRKTIYPSWVAINMKGRDGSIPAEFGDFLMSTVANKAASEVESAIYRGGATTGFKGLLSNDGVFDAAGLGASRLAAATAVTINALSASNIIAEVGKVYAKAGLNVPGLIGKDDTQILLGSEAYAMYQQGLATSGSNQGVNMQGTNQSFGALTYLGVPVNLAPGMFADAIIMCQKSNLFLGTNLGTDLTEAKLIPFYEYDGSDNVGVSMKMAWGVQVGVVSDVVIGKTF